jgi:hypothetical protein
LPCSLCRQFDNYSSIYMHAFIVHVIYELIAYSEVTDDDDWQVLISECLFFNVIYRNLAQFL